MDLVNIKENIHMHKLFPNMDLKMHIMMSLEIDVLDAVISLTMELILLNKKPY
jgi:hypothetical protein